MNFRTSIYDVSLLGDYRCLHAMDILQDTYIALLLTGNSYELGLLKSINGFGDSTSARNNPFTYACAAGQLIQGFAAQQCSVTSGHPNRALCNLQFRCTVAAPPPTSPSPQPPSTKVYSPPRPPPPPSSNKTATSTKY